MEGKDNKVPKLRFPGFEGEWKEKELKALAEKNFGGGTPATSNPLYWNGRIPWIQSSDVIEGKLVGIEQNKYISEEGLRNSAAQLVPENSIAVVTRVGVGKLVLIPFAYTTSQDFLSLSKLKIDSLFAVYAFYKKIHSEANKVQGTSIKGITKKELLVKKISVPEENGEQVKLGKFFNRIDDLIEQHKDKMKQLQQLKKGLLQKMFPKDGEKVPELRFPEFSGDWEESRLRDLGSLKNGMNFFKKDMGKGFPFVNLQNIFGRNRIDDNDLGKALATSRQLEEYNLIQGDILFVRSSVKLDGVGEAALVPKNLNNTTYSGFIIRFRDERGMDDNFKRFVFAAKDIRKQLITQATDSANKNINQVILSEVKILLPEKAEQHKVGELFSQLDDLIALHQRKLEHLQQLKRGLLQQMLV